MNKNIKKFISMLITASLLMGITTTVFASGMMSSFFGAEVVVTVGNQNSEIVSMASEVLGFLQYVGIAIAIGMVIYAGMRYTMSAANERAELKQASIRLVIGAVIVAGVSGIFPVVWKSFESLATT